MDDPRMYVRIDFTDDTTITRLGTTKIGRKILSRTLNKLAVSGKAEGKRGIGRTYTVKPGKVRLFTTRATTDRLESSVGATSVDARGKRAIPLHEFSFKWRKAPKGRKAVAGFPAPLVGEIVRGSPTKWRGGFSVLGSDSGKRVAIRRVGEARYPTTTLLGPSVGAMLTNPRVTGPLMSYVGERMPTVLTQEIHFAMDYEQDRGKEAPADVDD